MQAILLCVKFERSILRKYFAVVKILLKSIFKLNTKILLKSILKIQNKILFGIFKHNTEDGHVQAIIVFSAVYRVLLLRQN